MNKLKRASIAFMFLLILSIVAPSLISAFSNVTSAEAAATVKFNKSKLTLYVGKTYKLKITGTTATITWSSSKKSVATVTKAGKVTAKKAGKTTITATVNGKKYTCKVTVKASTESAVSQTTVYGKVTAISGIKVTLALGTMNQPGGTPPSGQPSEQSSGQPDGAPDLLTLTGETITITISDTSILSKQSMQAPNNQTSTTTTDTTNSTATLSDIAVGSILQITYTTSIDNLVSVQILGGDQAGSFQPDGTSGGASSANTGTGAYDLTDGEALTSGTYTSTNADENAIRAEGSITASLTDVTVAKTAGTASSSDASSFYGLNAAILALGGSTLDITGGNITATTEGSNGVFAYNGATINIKNTTIDVSGGNAGGIEVAGGGIMNATNLTVTSKDKAAIRSDRGGGTMTVNGGAYTTTGLEGAPSVYSTANITVNDATLTAKASEAIVVEGLNSVTLNNCTVTGNMSGTYGSSSGKNIHNVMLFQSMSGDAEVGNSSFTMTDGSLISKNGDMFYVTNTECTIKLSNVALTLADDTNLLLVAGNNDSRGWGKEGSNGGDCTFEVTEQTLSGDITVDSISKLDMTIKASSSFTGAINSDGTTASALSVTLDSTSTWTLTADSYVTKFSGSMNNVNTNGHTLYVNGVAMN